MSDTNATHLSETEPSAADQARGLTIAGTTPAMPIVDGSGDVQGNAEPDGDSSVDPSNEQDNPNVKLIFVAVLAILTVVTVIVVGLIQLFNSTMRAEVERKQLAPVNSMLREVYATEQAKLSRYQWTDQNAGILRIPLDRAKQLVLADYSVTSRGAKPAGASSGAVGGVRRAASVEAGGGDGGGGDPPERSSGEGSR